MRLRWLPKRIFTRFLLIIAVPAILMQGMSTFMFYHRHWSDVSSNMAQTVASEVTLLDHLLTLYPEETNRIIQQFNGRIFDQIIIRPRSMLPPAENSHRKLSGSYVVFTKKLYRTLGKNAEVTLTPDHQVQVRLWIQQGELIIHFSHKRFDPPTSYIFVLWMLGTAMVLVLVAILFMRTQIRSIVTLADMAEKFGKGQKLPNFKPSGALEVRQAGRAFLKMIERIERQIVQRTELLAGVSHDLRTPLTRITLQLAMMPQSEEVQHMQGDLGLMERMIQEYLDFAKGEGQETPHRINLTTMLQEWLEPYREQEHVRIILPAECYVTLRPIAMKRALQNLLDNALSYGQNVEIRVKEFARFVEIAFGDDGPGVPEDKREAIFRPFYRLDSARNLREGGVGLGLAISKDIIHGHGGMIEVQRHPYLGGALFIVRLPK